MKIATWNVNSIRKRLPAVLEWLRLHKPDIMCLQETKVQDAAFPEEAFRSAGYIAAFRGMKGYNGVATLTAEKAPDIVVHGFDEGPDNEDARVLQVATGGLVVINTYVPQGYKVGTDRYEFKLRWFERMRSYLEQRFHPGQHIVWTGDMNVAPEPIDVYHPDRRVNDVDFHIDARNAYRGVMEWGFVDVFRMLHPERIQYTYWDYFRNALANNWGWRIDHILATHSLAQRCTASDVDMEPRRGVEPSDHTVVWADFDIPHSVRP